MRSKFGLNCLFGMILFLQISCNNKNALSNIDDFNEKSYNLKVSEEDTCFINYDNIFYGQEYQCKYYSFLYSSYFIDNSDYGVLLYVLNSNDKNKIIEIYSSSTGRKKILFIAKSNVLESNWFDDDASGDNILIETISKKGFYSFDSISSKKEFTTWLKTVSLLKNIKHLN